MPKVSVIIPVYNAEKHLSRSLDSVIKQSFADIEIICINDGSTDNSQQIIEKYKKLDSRIKLISQRNSGGSSARNAGIKHSTGEYVMFLDADDMYAQHIIEKVYNRALKTNVDIVLYDFVRFVGKPTLLATRSKINPGVNIEHFTKETHASRLFNDFATITWNKLVKKSVIDKNSLLFNTDLSHNHDVDFSIRLMMVAEKYSWLNEVGYYYRNSDTGITATKRSDPTNVLKILLKLNELFSENNKELKQSFDNYVIDMISGTLMKYSDDAIKQKEVFDYAHSIAIPSIIDGKLSIYDPNSFKVFQYISAGNWEGYIAFINAPNQRLRAYAHTIHDTAQKFLSTFAV